MPFSRTPSVDAVIRAASLTVNERQWKWARIVMYSPESGQTRFIRVQRGLLILLRDEGFYPLGLLCWLDKGDNVQAVAKIFPWFTENEVVSNVFGQICDVEVARVRDTFERRNLN